MRFFYLKLGKSNSHIGWLSGDNPLKRPAAVIFFRHCTIEDIRSGNCDPQAKNFYESSLPEAMHQTIMVVVANGKAWFLKPAGQLIEYSSPTDVVNLWKIMPVEVISSQRLTEVPLVLASINANTYLNTGTYREITNWGNIKAIHAALKWPLPEEHLKAAECRAVRLFECLSSTELETLVAKVFEAAGCFVPAYRGGYVKDVDLFAHNDRLTEIDLNGLKIPPQGGVSIQVKGRTSLKKCPEAVDYLIGFSLSSSSNCFDENWLLDQVKAFPSMAKWVQRSLSWLPQDFITNCGL